VPRLCEFFALAFALQLREKHGKTTVRVRETSVRLLKTSVRVQYTYYQDTHALQNRHKHTHYKTDTNTHITKPTLYGQNTGFSDVRARVASGMRLAQVDGKK
jgi:hypothetical protein